MNNHKTNKGKMKKDKLPLMYKGYILKICENGLISAYSYRTDYFINPLYKTFEQIKTVIDGLKDS